MKALVAFALLLFCSAAMGQEKPKDKKESDPKFLIKALNHAAQSIRVSAAQRLVEEDVDAVPALVDSILASCDLAAARAAAVLLERMDLLRRATPPAKEAPPKEAPGKEAPGKEAVERPPLKLTPQERSQMRRLLAVMRDQHAEGWRFYLAVYVMDKLDRDSLVEVLRELAAAAASGDGMKQYAFVQAMYHLGPAAATAQEALWPLLFSCSRFRGLFIARAVYDDEPAYTDEIGSYDIQFRLEDSFVLRELFVLDALRRVGAAPARLTAALACLAGHESPHVRLEAARQLGLLDAGGKSLSADVLIGLLCEHDSVLAALLSDENSAAIREDAIELFTRLGPAAVKTVPALARLLSAKETHLRKSAAIALGRIGPPAAAALPALQRALRFERLREGGDHEALAGAIEAISGKKRQKPKQAEPAKNSEP